MIVCELGQTTIQTVAFAADGQTLYAGTADGRVLAVVPFAESRVIHLAKPGADRIDSSRLTKLRCEISTPLGSPVVPDV